MSILIDNEIQSKLTRVIDSRSARASTARSAIANIDILQVPRVQATALTTREMLAASAADRGM